MKPINKAALLIAGQIRKIDKTKSVLAKLEEQAEVDVYIATWEGRGVQETLDLYKPVKSIVIPPSRFPSVKQEFWDAYKTRQTRKDVLDGRFSFLSGQFTNKRMAYINRDNALRMLFLNQQAINLVDKEYDVLVKTRPDFFVRNWGPLSGDANTIYSPANQYRNDAKGRYMSDQLFYGPQNIMVKTMQFWQNTPVFLVKHQDNFMAPTDTGWLSPEHALKIYIEEFCGCLTAPNLEFSGGIHRSKKLYRVPEWTPQPVVPIIR